MQEIGGIALNPDPDYGPVNTMRYDQNIDGHWVRDHTVRLYLIPDHLLADWRTAVRFNQVQELAVQSSGDFNPHDSTLLSIRCTSDDGRSRGVGFALSWDKAFELASLLEQHTGVVFEKVECKKEVG
jgi:hypothetical protein